MKEFVEKLIGRLEELKTFKLNLADAMSELMKKDRLDNYISREETVEIVNQLAEEYQSRIIIDGQYCWQTCACTEKCNECNRLTLASSDIDWYENIEDWTEEYRPRTNADFIRKMSDEELADFLEEFEACDVCKYLDNNRCTFENPCVHEFASAMIYDWLKSEVKGSE